MPGGFSLELDTAESARLWHAGWRADPAGAKVVLGFMLATRQAVDEAYAELTSAGYRGRQPPFDAFWGARYAIVADPDGNDVGLMSPVEDSRLTWPPQQSPRPPARQHGAGAPPDGYHAASAPQPARLRGGPGKCRVTVLAIPDHVCENSRMTQVSGRRLMKFHEARLGKE
jgi:Glyoxalase/Bleomycin resistance protein/Dioxygenase superfamily